MASKLNALYEICCIVEINCVRWEQNGKRLASASYDGIVKVLDFASGKLAYKGNTVDESKSSI